MNKIAIASLAPGYTVILFDNIKSAGLVQYAFLVAVSDDKTRQPIYIVTSEVNTTAATLGGRSHFLGIFDGEVMPIVVRRTIGAIPRSSFRKRYALCGSGLAQLRRMHNSGGFIQRRQYRF